MLLREPQKAERLGGGSGRSHPARLDDDRKKDRYSDYIYSLAHQLGTEPDAVLKRDNGIRERDT
ncbi:MAG: hypothetical protein NVS4B3_07220 [Gemmatimonadaceae bacterium]